MHLSGPLAAYFSAKGVPPEVGPPLPFPPVPPPFPLPIGRIPCSTACAKAGGGVDTDCCRDCCAGIPGFGSRACLVECYAVGNLRLPDVGTKEGLGVLGNLQPLIVIVLGIFLILIALALITR